MDERTYIRTRDRDHYQLFCNLTQDSKSSTETQKLLNFNIKKYKDITYYKRNVLNHMLIDTENDV